MTEGRPKADLVVTHDERAQLVSFARSRSLPALLSARARIILSNAEGEANSSIAERPEFDSILKKLHRLCSRISGTGH